MMCCGLKRMGVIWFMKIGKLYLHSPYGKESFKVKIVKYFFGLYRIEALGFTRLAGNYRYLCAGDRAWVPEYAIRVLCEDKSA